jgi:hypothetical protein
MARQEMKIKRLLQLFLLMTVAMSFSAPLFAQVSIGIAVHIGPPVLPVYAQPICPGPNYLWTPGYWAWNGYDYFWVPGTWVMAPAPGLLWTPGYWGWGTGGYFWHAGYWGPHIGFYGGVNYGFGYYGSGYEGGYWRGNSFFYNTAITRVNTTVIRNVYVNRTVINNVHINNTRVSYNGGQGGIQARPSATEQTALNERRMGPVNAQLTHQQVAQQDRGNFFKSNHGTPDVAAVARPAASVNDFRRDSVAARPAPAQVNRPETRPAPTQRPENTNRPNPGTPAHQAPDNRPQYNEARPQTQPQQRNEARPAPQQHSEPRPQSEPHSSEPHGDGHPGRDR